MKIAILDTSKKEVLNVVAAKAVGDLPKVKAPLKYVEGLSWMGPGKEYTETDGVLFPVVVPITPEQITAAEDMLRASCLAYQVAQIDGNTNTEITKSESLVEAGKATAADLPTANAAGDWLRALWAEFYARKVDALNVSHDFSTVAPLPEECTFTGIRTERKTFLGV